MTHERLCNKHLSNMVLAKKACKSETSAEWNAGSEDDDLEVQGFFEPMCASFAHSQLLAGRTCLCVSVCGNDQISPYSDIRPAMFWNRQRSAYNSHDSGMTHIH